MRRREPKRVELIGRRGVSSGRGWTMYCDRCGTQLTSGGQFCSKCGKPIVPSAGRSSPGLGPAVAPAGAATESEGRVQRHIQLLAWFWLANGVLRLLEVGWLLFAGHLFFPFAR